MMDNETQSQNNPSQNYTSTDETSTVTDELYKYFLPIMFLLCIISIVINIKVLISVHWIRRPLSPTLHISLSLAAADACTSALFGTGLLINSYLRDVEIPCHVSFVLEIYRLSGVIITVFHLLALSINHWLGIIKPLHYNTMVTSRKITIVTIILWFLPIIFFNTYFFISSEEIIWHNMTSNCTEVIPEFYNGVKFRIIFSHMFFIPLFLMIFCYAHILHIVRKQQQIWAKLSRSGSQRRKGVNKNSSTQQRKTMEGNVKAIYTTLLILGSCMIGWLPATVTFLLVCGNGCLYTNRDVSNGIGPVTSFFISWTINSLIILKTIANPIIYSSRMMEIREGIRRMKLAISGCHSNRRDQFSSNLQPLQLGYSGSMNALCKLNGTLTKRSIRSTYPNTLV